MAANLIRMQPGPSQMAVSHVQDMSCFKLFIPDSIQRIILDCTNLQGRRAFGDRWKEIDKTHLHAYFRVSMLDRLFRSKPLWDAETGLWKYIL